jgi:hypothetical protein
VVSAGGVVCFIVGTILFFVGLILLIGSLNLPALFAGQYLIFSGLVMVAGVVLWVLGYRTGRNKKLEPKPVATAACKNCASNNPVTSEFCASCGIRI